MERTATDSPSAACPSSEDTARAVQAGCLCPPCARRASFRRHSIPLCHRNQSGRGIDILTRKKLLVLFHVLSNVEQPPMNTKEPIRARRNKGTLQGHTTLQCKRACYTRARASRRSANDSRRTSTDSALPRRHTKVLRFPSALRVPYCFRPSEETNAATLSCNSLASSGVGAAASSS